MQSLPIILIKACAGGCLVVLFASLAQPIKPKTLAGIFGAAPSIAIASFGVTLVTEGPAAAHLYGLGMIGGAVAMAAYCLTCSALTKRLGAMASGGVAIIMWAVVAVSIYGAFLT